MRALGRVLTGMAAIAAIVAAGVPGVAATRSALPHRLGSPLHVYGNLVGDGYVAAAGRPVSISHPDHVIGRGTAASCTSAAVVQAVAEGGVIVFQCGPRPVTITMTATAKVMNTSHRVVIDGGGKVTLSGAGQRRILYLDTCDRTLLITSSDCYTQKWPQLIVQNIALSNGNSQLRQIRTGAYGGGAIFAKGGQLKVVNVGFFNDQCYQYGPDLGGGAIRALAQWQGGPVYLVQDTFRGGQCSNGSALSSIGVSWVVVNCVMTGNEAIGLGANPAIPGTPGGGSGGAIYTDGGRYSVLVSSTVIRDNSAREGGGAIFFVSNNRTGKLTIKNSRLQDNPSGVFWTRAYPGIYFHSSGRPIVIGSSIN